jgi:hypothetical protein
MKWLNIRKNYIYELEGKPLVTISIVECPHVHIHNHVVQMLQSLTKMNIIFYGQVQLCFQQGFKVASFQQN